MTKNIQSTGFEHLTGHDQSFWHPMTHPGDSLANPARIFVKAEGVEITDNTGHSVLDAVGGLWNVNLGYSCEPVKKAINEQLQQMPFYSSFRGTTTAPVIELSAALKEWFAEDGMTRSFFTSGGSDSVETCLRLARQYHKIRGDKDRYKFISLKKATMEHILVAHQLMAIQIFVVTTNHYYLEPIIFLHHGPIVTHLTQMTLRK